MWERTDEAREPLQQLAPADAFDSVIEAWAHDMVCTAKGADVIFLVEVRDPRSPSAAT